MEILRGSCDQNFSFRTKGGCRMFFSFPGLVVVTNASAEAGVHYPGKIGKYWKPEKPFSDIFHVFGFKGLETSHVSTV